MSNTGQTDLGFNGEYHHDINLLLGRIAELESVIRNVTLIAEYPPKDRAILDELSKLTTKD